MKNFIWNSEDQCIRGSFVNLLITLTILGLIVAGAFVKDICNNLVSLSTLIIGFFTVSFGVWQVTGVAKSFIAGNQTPPPTTPTP